MEQGNFNKLVHFIDKDHLCKVEFDGHVCPIPVHFNLCPFFGRVPDTVSVKLQQLVRYVVVLRKLILWSLKIVKISVQNKLLSNGDCILNVFVNEFEILLAVPYKWTLPLQKDYLKVQSNTGTLFKNINFISKKWVFTARKSIKGLLSTSQEAAKVMSF